MSSCLTRELSHPDGSTDKIKFPCQECKDYLLNELKPQMENCGTFIIPDKNYKPDLSIECKYDSKEIKKFGGCLLGMKREHVESIMGFGRTYSWPTKGRLSHMIKLTLYYNENENRLIGISDIEGKDLNRQVPCMGCEDIYKDISSAEKIKSMNFESFTEKYKGCFYDRLESYLKDQLALREKTEEYNYHFSYTKTIELKDSEHKVKFIFAPTTKMVEMKVVE